MNFISLWLPVVAWAGLIYFLSSIPSLNSGLGLWDFVLRKIAHMTEFAVFTSLLVRAFKKTWVVRSRTVLYSVCGGLSLLYAISDEFHQCFVPGREGCVRDVMVDLCGIGLFLVVYNHWSKKGMS